ncbi:hypothetical protein JEZ13_07215 [bacterium]|nr:hypothetical protein [bacterium]
MKKSLCLIISIFSLGLLFGDSQKLLQNYFSEDTFANMLAVLEDAEQNIDNITATYNLMVVHLNELSKVMAELEMNADNLQAGQRFQLANTYLALGKMEEAISHYDFLNTNYETWSCPWRHKGEAYYNLEDWENSARALEKAIETRIEHYDAYLWLARVQLKLKKNKAALKTFETGMSYKGKDIEDPEEEFSSEEESFLKLDIFKANKMRKDVKELEPSLKAKYPDSQYWTSK